MSVITVIVLIFAALGAIDFIIGNKTGMGAAFEKAFAIFCPMALTMLGMIVLAPAIGVWLNPFFTWFYNAFGIDPSILPASILANDMGGASLATSICLTPEIGGFNAYVVSSMLGCVISFTVPFSLGLVKKEQQKDLFFGLLCGIATVPFGCFVGGLLCGLSPLIVLLDLLPVILFSLLVGAALILVPKICVKCFEIFGTFIKALAIVGLALSMFTFLTKIEINPYFDTLENAAMVCVNACVVLAGMLPFMHVLSTLLDKPLNKLGNKVGLNAISTISLLATIVTSATVFGVMDKMNRKGVVLNAAFAVSAAFALGSHLAFTMALDERYVLPMIVGKLVSGVAAVTLAAILFKDTKKATA
ncbi:MAG: ethanolamine utilization protein EutH [Clostridia bacterium]|nr:ethanolamine utilization protein EutH [Clostridia bacterium]